MKNFKNIISENRKKLNITQRQLADKINVSDKQISKWETGVSYPDITMLNSLAKALEISVNELLESDDLKVNDTNESTDYDLLKEIKKTTIVSFRTKMIISILLLLFVPILAFLGTLLSSRLIFNLFVVLGAIGYIVSFGLSISSSINIYNYIKNNRYSKKYINTLKKYNLIYYAIIFLMLNISLLIARQSIIFNFQYIIMSLPVYLFYGSFINIIHN